MPDPNLSSVPPELLSIICFHLNRRSLASFALTSSRNYAAALPILYRHIKLPYTLPAAFEAGERADSEGEVQERQKAVIRAALESLAEDEAKCRMIRVVEVRNYGKWLSARDAELPEKVVKQAQGVEEVRLLQDDDGEPFDPLLTPLAHFGPIWAALQSLPNLRKLQTSYGPNVQLNLHDFPALEEVEIEQYFVDNEHDGELPAKLRKLRLEYVTGFEQEDPWDSWFHPKLFTHLDSLTLIDMPLLAMNAITEAVEYLTICSTPDPTSFPAALNPLRADPNAATVSAGLETSAAEPLHLLFSLAYAYRQTLHGMALYFGEEGDELVAVKTMELFTEVLDLVCEFRSLDHFETNLVLYHESFASATVPPTAPASPYVSVRLAANNKAEIMPIVSFLSAANYARALPPPGLPRSWGGDGGLGTLVIANRGTRRKKGWRGFWALEEEFEAMREQDDYQEREPRAPGDQGLWVNGRSQAEFEAALAWGAEPEGEDDEGVAAEP
ncbi:hypothetical protein JCM10213_000189 [Rhodosporidiobolus nylandii]